MKIDNEEECMRLFHLVNFSLRLERKVWFTYVQIGQYELGISLTLSDIYYS